MSYEQRLTRTKLSVIQAVKDEITGRYNYNNEFHMWSYTRVSDGYVSKFKNDFSISREVEDTLWFASQNIKFVVQSFIDLNPNYTLKSLLRFVEKFLTTQLADIENWCEIYDADTISEEEKSNPE